MWLHLTTISVVAAMVSIYVIPAVYPLVVVRWLLGALVILYLPGFSLIEALFLRRDDIAAVDKVALSIGLSLAISPLIGIALNYTPWGIRLEPITASLFAFVLFTSLLASYRKFNYQRSLVD